MKRRSYLAGTVAIATGGCFSAGERGSVVDGERSNGSDDEPPVEGDAADGEEGTDDEPAGEPPELAGTYDDFEDLSAWRVIEGSLEADEDRSFVGSQSALLTADRDTDRVVIAREFSEPEDCTSIVPGIAMTVDGPTVPTIQLFDGDGGRLDLRRPTRGDLPFARYNFGVTGVFGRPDLSDVREVRIVHRRGRLATNRLWCDDLHFVPRPETGKVMIQFDDGYETDYTVGYDVLREYGYPAVTFVNPGRIGGGPFLDVAQAEELRDAGWTIANHTDTHANLAKLSADGQEAEIRRGKEWLLDHGFDRGARYFAYPFGQYDATTLDLVEKHHALGFAGGPPAQGLAVNPVLCSRIGDPSAEEAIEYLDLTAKQGGITGLFYHLLEGELREDFEEAMAHLHELESAGEVEIITPRDLEEDLTF